MPRYSNADIANYRLLSGCCLVEKNYDHSIERQNGELNPCFENLLLGEYIETLGHYTVVGTVISYTLDLTTDIDLSGLIPFMDDGMVITITVITDVGTTFVATVTGDYAAPATLSDLIDDLVTAINNSGTGFTAVNLSPIIRISFVGSSTINFLGATFSIQLADFYYLKNETSNARRTATRALGYGTIQAKRPTFVETLNKLYIPNGDSIQYIYPSTAAGVPPAGNFPPAGATLNSITKDFTGAVVGSAFVDVIAPGLTLNYFTAGVEFLWNRTVVDPPPANLTTGGSYNNVYAIRCRIDAYNVVTGQLNYTIVANASQGFPVGIIRNGQSTGLGGGNSMPAVTQAVPVNLPTEQGTTGGTAIGSGVWTFGERGVGWGTVSIYSVVLATGALTFIKDLEIPAANSQESLFFDMNDTVFVSGYGLDLTAGNVTRINTTTDLVMNFVDLDVTGNLGIMYNPVKQTSYAFSGTVLSKLDDSLNYDIAVNQSVGCGSISFDQNGSIYLAPTNLVLPVIKFIQDPTIPFNSADPVPITKFTVLDFTTAAPNAFVANYDGQTAATGLSMTVTPLNLDIYNLIWVAGALFKLTFITGGVKYIINGRVVSYVNVTGALIYDIVSVQSVPAPYTGTPTTLAALPVLGSVSWTWETYPAIFGVIAMHFHAATGVLFLTRQTTVGALLQSYSIISGGVTLTEPQILASRQNHIFPTNPNLSGNLNYQVIEDRFFLPSSTGINTYVFDPNDMDFLPRSVQQPTGGMQLFSYTGDETDPANINMFAATPGGTQGSVVSLREGASLTFDGVFDGTSTGKVTTAEDNCLTEKQVSQIISYMKEICPSLCPCEGAAASSGARDESVINVLIGDAPNTYTDANGNPIIVP